MSKRHASVKLEAKGGTKALLPIMAGLLETALVNAKGR